MFVALFPVTFALMGMLFEYMNALSVKMDLINTAQLVAMAGCSKGFDKHAFMYSYQKRLKESDAKAAVEEYLDYNQPKNYKYKLASCNIDSENCTIEITLSCDYPTQFSRYFNIKSIYIDGTSKAHTNMKKIGG